MPSGGSAVHVPGQWEHVRTNASVSQEDDENDEEGAEGVDNGKDVGDAEDLDDGRVLDGAEDLEGEQDLGSDADADDQGPTLWIIRNTGNYLGYPPEWRMGDTDFWFASPPAGHENDRLQPCDVPGCTSKFKPGSVIGLCHHDGRTHRRLAYACPNPHCGEVLGRPESLQRHCEKRPDCLHALMWGLWCGFGYNKIPDFDHIRPFLHLPLFATMKTPTRKTQKYRRARKVRSQTS